MKDLYDAVDDVLAHSSAEGTARLCMAGFAWHMNVQTFETRPGHKRLMRYTRRSEKTIDRAIALLETELQEIVQVGRGGKGRTATYRILVGTQSPSRIGDGLSEPSTRHSARHSGGHSPSRKVTGQPNTTNNYPSFSPSSNGGGAQLEAIAPDLFETILRRLAVDIGNGFIAHTYVEPLEQRGRRGDVLEVLAPDYCELELARRYGARLTAIAREVLGERVDVEIVTERQLHRGVRGGPR